MSVIFFIGAFPPPVHGMSAVNAEIRDILQDEIVETVICDTSAHSLKRSLFVRLGRLPRIIRGLTKLAFYRRKQKNKLYMSVSGGFGQLYEILFVVIARWRSLHIFLHHHSFAYLDKSSLLTRALINLAGDKAVHITLSPIMARRLANSYSAVNVVTISNAVFFADDQITPVPRKQLLTLGFLANIAPEKGVFEFLELMAAVQTAGLNIQGKLAGPFQDAETEMKVRERLVKLPSVEYVGPKYGIEKTAFYDGIDVLVFPTRYINEAEPLVLHEAMSHGIPVIVNGRGCIPDIVNSDCGLVVDPAEPFQPAALSQIQAWLAEPAEFTAASRAAATCFAQTYAKNEARWNTLLEMLLNDS